jgi:hypothetical protein
MHSNPENNNEGDSMREDSIRSSPTQASVIDASIEFEENYRSEFPGGDFSDFDL